MARAGTRPVTGLSASRDRAAGIYGRHGTALYRQALLALGDRGRMGAGHPRGMEASLHLVKSGRSLVPSRADRRLAGESRVYGDVAGARVTVTLRYVPPSAMAHSEASLRASAAS